MWIGLVAGAVGTAGVLAYGARGRSSTLFAPSVWRGVSGRRSIALTFDDGPSESTPEALELLDRYGARATFFQCGANVRRLPGIAAEVARAGHEIGNHGDGHRAFYLRAPGFIYEELARAQEAIERATGRTPSLLRVPFGVRWFGLRQAQARLGLLGVMWTVIGLDWKLPGGAVAKRLLDGIENGAILCLHDGRELRERPGIGATLEALRICLPRLRDLGFRFETVSEILCPNK